MLYFVVRIDVTSGDGKQRVFGAFDKRADADKQVADLENHMRAVFRVFQGYEAA